MTAKPIKSLELHKTMIQFLKKEINDFTPAAMNLYKFCHVSLLSPLISEL